MNKFQTQAHELKTHVNILPTHIKREKTVKERSELSSNEFLIFHSSTLRCENFLLNFPRCYLLVVFVPSTNITERKVSCSKLNIHEVYMICLLYIPLISLFSHTRFYEENESSQQRRLSLKLISHMKMFI